VSKTKLRNFHLPLNEEDYIELREVAVRSKKTATELARAAIKNWLKEEKRKSLYNSIANFASEYAGTDIDLDKDLENTSIDYLKSSGG